MKELKLFHGVTDIKYENGRYTPVRFTDKQLKSLAKLDPVYEKFARSSAGVVLKFYTKKDIISFEFEAKIFYTKTGSFDVYENGVLTKSFSLAETDSTGKIEYCKENEGESLIEIYLPNNAGVALWNFDLGEYRTAEEKDTKVMFCGDSITQCAYITTSSLTFANIASRIADAECLNRGVGSLYFDETTLDEDDTADPDIIFVEFGANDVVKRENGKVVFDNDKVVYRCEDDLPEMAETIEKYLKKLKCIYPNAKINVISMLWNMVEAELLDPVFYEKYREDMKIITEKLGLCYIDGRTVIPHLRECLAADKIHLSQLGAAMAAQKIYKYIGK